MTTLDFVVDDVATRDFQHVLQQISTFLRFRCASASTSASKADQLAQMTLLGLTEWRSSSQVDHNFLCHEAEPLYPVSLAYNDSFPQTISSPSSAFWLRVLALY